MSWDPDKYNDAWLFAARAHGGQKYGGPIEGDQFPYILHLGNVAMEFLRGALVDAHCDVDFGVQCALLHDTIEDTETTEQQLTRWFGAQVSAGVSALSKDLDLPTKDQQMADSLRRIKAQPREVWMVKLADRISNLSEPPHHWREARVRRYQDEARLILTELGPASAALSSRLEVRIERYGTYLPPA